jgi:hypothetical protein
MKLVFNVMYLKLSEKRKNGICYNWIQKIQKNTKFEFPK